MYDPFKWADNYTSEEEFFQALTESEVKTTNMEVKYKNELEEEENDKKRSGNGRTDTNNAGIERQQQIECCACGG